MNQIKKQVGKFTHGLSLRFRLLVIVGLCGLTVVISNPAYTQNSDDKTSFVEQLRSTMESGGSQAATAWFQENWPANKSQYSVDTQELMMLMSEYMAAGDNDAAQALGEITSTVLQDTMTDTINTHAPDMAAEMEVMRKKEAEQELRDAAADQNNQQQIALQSRGEAREDLNRFKGLYGASGARQIFVVESCDGFMVAGPMWADVSAWWMRSAADHVFSYSDSFTSLAFDFELDDEGQAISLSHDLDGVPNLLPRYGDLPPEYADCIPRPRR